MQYPRLPKPEAKRWITVFLCLALIFSVTSQVLASPGKEIVEKRTLATKTFDNGDGTFTFEAHAGHIHYVDKTSGILKDCDTTLIDMGDKWVQSKASYQCEIPKYANGDFVFVDVFDGKNQTVVMRPLARHVPGEIQNSDGWVKQRIIYRNAYGQGLHLRVTAGNEGLFKEIIIENKPYPLTDLSFDFEISPPSEQYAYVFDSRPEDSPKPVLLANLSVTGSQQFLMGQGSTAENAFTRIKQIRIWDSDGDAMAGRIQFYREGSKLCFRKIVPKEFLATATYPVYTDDTVTYYTGAGDGYVQKKNSTNWNTTHDAASGSAVDYLDNLSFFCRTGVRTTSNKYIITRGFFPFDTSALPDTAIISAASLDLYITAVNVSDNDGADFVVLVQTTQASTSYLTTADFNSCGAVHNPIEGSPRYDMSGITSGGYRSAVLNETGRGWISKTGWTKLGMREGHDVLDHPYVGPQDTKNRIHGYWSEQAGTSQDPKLSITYQVESTITISGTAYESEGGPPLAYKPIMLRVDGSNAEVVLTDANGVYAFSEVPGVSAGSTVTVWIKDGPADPNGTTVTIANDASSSITGLDIYASVIIARSDKTGTAITNDDLDAYDKGDDSEIHFSCDSGSLTVDNDHELHVWTGVTFAPGGPVTTLPGGASPGGDIHIDNNAIFTAAPPGFGSDGIVTYDSGGAQNDYSGGIAVDSSGNTYVVGSQYTPSTGYDIVVLRYNSSGSLDTSWGDGDGIVTYNSSDTQNDYGRGIAVDSSGNCYVAGDQGGWAGDTGGNGSKIVVLKYNSNGVLDTSWGSDGIFTYTYGYGAGAWGIDIDSSGNSYVTGHYYSGTVEDEETQILTSKINSSGNFDTTWGGGDGKVTYGTGIWLDSEYGRGIAVDSSGNCYVVGYQPGSGNKEDIVVLKYDPNGDLDTTWGDSDSGKIVYNSLGDYPDYGRSIAVDSSGNCYVVGDRGETISSGVILRYDSNGDLDTTWGGGDGIFTIAGIAGGIDMDSSNNCYVTTTFNCMVEECYDEIRVYKLDSTGALDTSWGYNGLTFYGGQSWESRATTRGIAVDSLGNCYVAGEEPGKGDLVVLKYDSSGDLYTGAGTPISCGGSWTANTGSTFVHNDNTVTFTATDTENSITTNSNPFYSVTFDGMGGGWTLQDDATATNDFTIANGTVTGPGGTLTGANWFEATSSAEWAPGRYTHASTVYQGKIWVLGGFQSWYHNDVWYSADGANWTQATSSANWGKRYGLTSIVYDGKMWVLGGFEDPGEFKSDVWYSTDGANWTQATSNGGWGRQGHTSVVYDGKMWVIGGYAGNYVNSVWYSTDGVNWTEATSSADWIPRYGHTSVVYDGKMWVIGGYGAEWPGPYSNMNDVWYSTDGVNWTEATPSASWAARMFATSVVHDGKIWVIGGHDGTSHKNDVWHSTDGVNWTEATSAADWSARYCHTSEVHDGKMWVIGGSDSWGSKSDVWYSGGRSITVGGDWSNSDTFAHNGCTVIFDGTSAQQVTTVGSDWSAIEITNASAGGVSFTDAFTCATFTDTAPGSTLYFAANETFTITDSAGLTLAGASGDPITLRRYGGSDPEQWTINPSGGSWNVSYVDVADSSNIHADLIDPSDSTDSGNNTNWFTAGPTMCTLTMAVSGNGSTTPSVGAHVYAAGTVVDISAIGGACWQFVNWTGDVADPNAASTTVTMDGNKTVTANFSQIMYSLTMAVSGNGSTTPAVGVHYYACGTVVDISALGNACWQFDNWTGDVADPNAASTTVTMDGNKTVTANFSEIMYTLTLAVSGNGSTTPAVGAHSYACGTVVDISAVADACWQFVNWTGDVADPNASSTTVTMDDNKTLTANFSEIMYTLTLAVTGNGSTTPAVGAHPYTCATVVDISAVADSGWQFVYWTGDVADPNSADTTVTMDDNKTVTANFTTIGPPDDVSHLTHQTGTKGPGLGDDCSQCHTSTPESAANVDWSACTTCHSPGGAFDGVNDPAIGCIANWECGVYDAAGTALQSGKEQWCATCHDDAPAYSKPTEPLPIIVVDNPDGSFSGSWGTSNYTPGHYSSNYHYHTAASGSDTFTWSPTITAAGTYEVFARWTTDPTGEPDTSRAPDASYTIYHDGGSTPVMKDQQYDGGEWVSLGTFSFNGAGVEKVELLQSANGMVIADAMMFAPPETGIVVDNPAGTPSGDWFTSGYAAGHYGVNYHYHLAASGGDNFRWTPTITTAGIYEVLARWTEDMGRAPDATYTVHHDGGSTPVTKDQRYHGGEWVSLGTFSFDGAGDEYVELAQSENGMVIADAVKWDDPDTPRPGTRAPNVMGDGATYFYYDLGNPNIHSGHSIDCLACHEATSDHIDHRHRTYSRTSENYQAGYRLRSVEGQEPMNIPRAGGDPIANWRDFALCFDCHDRNEVLGQDEYDVDRTNFWDPQGEDKNSHYVHLEVASIHADSDWDEVPDSPQSCITCHNVHGSPTAVMIRHGELISTYGMRDKLPALSFGYVTASSDPDIDPSATLALSIAGKMDYTSSEISQNRVCEACHGVYTWYRSPYLGAKVLDPEAAPQVVPADGLTNVLFTVTLLDHNDNFSSVTIDLSPIDRSSTQPMYDDGTNGDQEAYDGTYSYQTTVPESVDVEDKAQQESLLVTVDDPDGPPVYANIDLVVTEPGVVIVDNLEGSYSGAWGISRWVPGYFGSNYHYHAAGSGSDTFTWSLPISTAGTYEVFARWTQDPDRAPDATYTIYHDSGSAAVSQDQRCPGGHWISLGTYDFDGTDDYIELSENPNGTVIADAIMVAPATETVIVDNPDGSYSGAWDTSTYTLCYYGLDYHYHDAGSGSDTFRWTPTITTAGQYEVLARWTEDASRAPDATYTIHHDAGTTPVSKDQRGDGGVWISLGSFSFDGVGDEYVELVENPNGMVIADAIKWELQP